MSSKKSTAKANGLKSTFKIDENQYFMTSFGKGNVAQEEKNIEGKEVINLNNTFTAVVGDKNDASITGVVGNTNIQLPYKDNNQLHAKAAIEQMFFGKNFTDNIHIQIAYNIMDIKKLLSVYANNIIYSVNNLLRMDHDKDFVGTFGTMNNITASKIAYEIVNTKLITKDKGKYKYYFVDMNVWNKHKKESLSELNNLVEKNSDYNLKCFQKISNCIVNDLGFGKLEFIQKAASSYEIIKNFGLCANYFSDVFVDSNENINITYIYECLRLLGNMRQTTFHSDDLKNEGKRKENTYTLFEIDSKASAETKTVLNEITKNKIDALNNNFINTSTVNLNILFSVYPNKDKKEIIKEYYDFSVRKVHKNMGFSVKSLRETILATEDDMQKLSGKKYDSVRSKLYSLIDYAIYNYYIENEEKAEAFVDSLRQLCVTKEKNKSGVTIDDKKFLLYQDESKRLWNDIGKLVNGEIIPNIEKCKSSDGIKKLHNKIDVNLKKEIKQVIQSSDDLSYFSKAMYCICAFLDGKEINMFLDSLINSFDNIVSFIKVSQYTNSDVKFINNYAFFNDCAKKADELRFVKSIARMNKGKKATKDSKVNIKGLHIKGFQYNDACVILGETNQEKINDALKLGEKNTEQKNVHTLRNFIINNVINSNKFNYVIRFVNPESARKIMENRALVSFAIGDIDDNQIIRYCESTKIPYNAKNPNIVEMRSNLVELLMQVNFDTFSKVSNNPKEAVEKERLKAIVGLYLTIIYLITKSLVRINTSYSIAFGIFERDCLIMQKKADMEEDETSSLLKDVSIDKNQLAITEYFAENFKTDSLFRGIEECKKYKEEEFKKKLEGKEFDKNLQEEFKKKYYKFCSKYKGKERAYIFSQTNIAHYDSFTFKTFRNNVEHMAVVSKLPLYLDDITNVKSYFDLYHYVQFRLLYDGKNGRSSINSDITKSKYGDVIKYQSACKDFLYGILAPFAYNPARYINLACKNKFIKSYGK